MDYSRDISPVTIANESHSCFMQQDVPALSSKNSPVAVEHRRTACLKYVLITPARNEADFIERTLESVVSQETLPLRWVVVSDGSTDGTDELVRKYAVRNNWIQLKTLDKREERNFASKANAVAVGYAALRDLDFDLIGSMDADISFDPDFFGFLVGKFGANPRLGVAGAAFIENGQTYDFRFASVEHVSGQCQLFRRQCFESIGGYLPSPCGGIDTMAVLGARMKGWETRTFPEKTFVHHRTMGTASTRPFAANFKHGRKDYLLGGHPLWQVFRCLHQMRKPPYLLGGFMLFAGYASCWFRCTKRPMPPDMVRFRRNDQMKRLKDIMRRFIGMRSAK